MNTPRTNSAAVFVGNPHNCFMVPATTAAQLERELTAATVHCNALDEARDRAFVATEELRRVKAAYEVETAKLRVQVKRSVRLLGLA